MKLFALLSVKNIQNFNLDRHGFAHFLQILLIVLFEYRYAKNVRFLGTFLEREAIINQFFSTSTVVTLFLYPRLYLCPIELLPLVIF